MFAWLRQEYREWKERRRVLRAWLAEYGPLPRYAEDTGQQLRWHVSVEPTYDDPIVIDVQTGPRPRRRTGWQVVIAPVPPRYFHDNRVFDFDPTTKKAVPRPGGIWSI